VPRKFSRTKTPHPTPPVCKGTIPDPDPDVDACLPTNVQVTITITDFDNGGTIVNGTGQVAGTNGGAGTIWGSTSVVLGLDVVWAIEHGELPPTAIPSARVTDQLGTVHLMGSMIAPRPPCPPFHTGPLTAPLIPGPGHITLDMYS
jgi:hypothetical protein